jgi:uncharacterized protein YecT (DUF1311 family)
MMASKQRIMTAAVLCAAFGIATSGAAQTGGFDADYARFRPNEQAVMAAHSLEMRRCMNASGGVTVAMRDCSAAEYDRVDSRLNANYRRVMARLPQARAGALRASQRRWLQTRWTRCDNDPDLEGGTLDLIIRDSCVLTELTRRTLWLGRM